MNNFNIFMCFVIRSSDPGPFYRPVNTGIDRVIGYYMENTWFSNDHVFWKFSTFYDCIATKMKQVL